MKARFGMIDNPWTGFYDSHWERRYVAAAFSDGLKVLPSADFGVGAMGSHADGLVGWHAVLVNGEGYSKVEVDAGKTAQLRFGVDPLAPGGKGNLPIDAFVSYALPGAEGEDATLIYAAGAGLKITPLILWVEYLGQSEGDVAGSGFTATAVPRIPGVLDLVARVARWDPDAAATGDAELTLIAGIGRDFYEKVGVTATFEQTTVEGADAESAIFLRAQAGF